MAEENKLEVEYLPLIQRFLYETTQIYTIAMNRKHEIVADLSYLEEPERERISQYLRTYSYRTPADSALLPGNAHCPRALQ